MMFETRVCWNCAAKTAFTFCETCGQHEAGPSDSPAFRAACGEARLFEEMTEAELSAEFLARIEAAKYDLEAPAVKEIRAFCEAREAAKKAEAAAAKAAEDARIAAEEATPTRQRVRKLEREIATETGLLAYSSYVGRSYGLRAIQKLRKELAVAKAADH